MYASAWMRVPSPTVVSFSISEPRPRMQFVAHRDALADARLVADDRVRADGRAREHDRARSRRRCCRRSPPAAAGRASPSSSRRATAACRRPRSRARARLRRAPCPGRRSRSGGSQPLSEFVSISSARTTRAPSVATRARSPLPAISSRKCVHSRRSGSSVAIFGNEDVARACLPLAVGLRALPRRLLVDGHLALELHVVEDDHLLAADDGQLPHLVRVEPREVHVRDLARREAEVAEDDVLDAGREEVAAVRHSDLGILVEQVEDHRQVVHAERPERVLVRADDAEVLPVAVDAEHVAELARVDQLLQLQDTRGGRAAGARASARGPAPRRARRARPSRRRASPAASRRRRACRPRAPASRARSASAPASRRRSRRASRRRAGRRTPPSPARPGSARPAARAAPRRGRRPRRARRARRSCARGSGPSS